MLGVWVKKLTFNDGSSFALSRNDIVVIVGANNSGKSRTINEINSWLSTNPQSGLLSVERDSEGTPDDIASEIIRYARPADQNNPSPPVHYLNGGQHLQGLKDSWRNMRSNGLQSLHSYFCRYLSTNERLSLVTPVQHIEPTRDTPSHPYHVLYQNDELAETLCQHFHKAFGTDITRRLTGARNAVLFVGERPELLAGEHLASSNYNTRLQQLPTIEEQGDGMKAFTGILLAFIMPHYAVMLIDEPEAFLHPPQARYLGRLLASELAINRQLFIATHSGDILRGLLDANAENVHVIRLNRKGNINHATRLNKEDIRHIWRAPLLRYSNVLDGLFHERVVICEGDADCRFYAAVMDAVYEQNVQENPRVPDIMFIHSGGLSGQPKIIQALRHLAVPISIITDFDVLRDKAMLESILEAAGHTFNEIEPKWRIIKDAIESLPPVPLTTSELKGNIDLIVTAESEEYASPDTLRRVRDVAKEQSSWREAKRRGKRIFDRLPAEDKSRVATAYNDLESTLHSWGVYIVPIGELESFDRSCGKKGAEWVAHILATESNLQGEKWDGAKTFVKQVTAYQELPVPELSTPTLPPSLIEAAKVNENTPTEP